MMTYAVVIVTYNRLNLCKECIYATQSQSVAPKYIVVVNNASTDGTTGYLEELSKADSRIHLLQEKKNLGGAGGFYKGIEYASKLEVDWIFIIDDDAVLERDYAEQIFKIQKLNVNCQVFAGTVKVDGEIDTYHRKELSKIGYLMKNIGEEQYKNPFFSCDIASFCGLAVSKDLIKKVGLPYAEYFIFHDDTEYCLRLRRESPCIVASEAVLNHKTCVEVVKGSRRYTWKDYFETRNRIWYMRQHGTWFDLLVCKSDIWINKVLRNFIFSLIKKDSYDWQYEKKLTRLAIEDGKKPLDSTKDIKTLNRVMSYKS